MHFLEITQSEWKRDRIRLDWASQERSRDTQQTLHDGRGRKRMKVSEQINDGASTPAAGATDAMQHLYQC
ncbi:hypothetical protein EVAR_57788_1 [Eumeta japonica]|uniref:Uncharacterized protein n=1 Tax=Eumeta variegata TaxID=151549 RepID=A0A4C1Y692_EUMVA|nr:hypothetical protein EVAR_57788_1 [Eumeta japonica]